MSVDVLDRRVLAAVRFTDSATGASVPDGLQVESSATFRENRSGYWVLWPQGVLDDHRFAFRAAPSSPAEGSVTVQGIVHDARRRFASRAFSIDVPREGEDLYTPVDVMLPSGPGRPVRQTWAAVWVSVHWDTDPAHPEPVPIEGALVRLSSDDLGGLRGIGLTDARGQALVVGAAIPRNAPSGMDSGSVLRPATDHDVDVVVETAQTHADTGRRLSVPDPDDLWDRRGALTTFSSVVALNAGDSNTLSVTVPRS